MPGLTHTFALWRVWVGKAARDCPYTDLSIGPNGISWTEDQVKKAGLLSRKTETVSRRVELSEITEAQCGWEFGTGASRDDPDYFLRVYWPGGVVKFYLVGDYAVGVLAEAVEALRASGVEVEDVHDVLTH